MALGSTNGKSAGGSGIALKLGAAAVLFAIAAFFIYRSLNAQPEVPQPNLPTASEPAPVPPATTPNAPAASPPQDPQNQVRQLGPGRRIGPQ